MLCNANNMDMCLLNWNFISHFSEKQKQKNKQTDIWGGGGGGGGVR